MERTLEEVGQAVARRRLELGMDAAEVARRAEVDVKTLASLERGERWPRDRSRARIEAALQWDAGSIDSIRSGKFPSVSGVIRGRDGQWVETFTALDGFEQFNLQRLRLGAIIMDARDLVQAQPGPLMTALTSILDEASELVIKVLAGEDGDIDDARWRIDQVRAGNSIRRVGDIYVADDGESVRGQAFSASHKAEAEEPEEDAPPLSLADAARTAPPGYTPGQAEQGDADDEANQDHGDEGHR